MDYIPSPKKGHLEAVAMEVVRRYPKSFKDTIGKESIGLGYGSLFAQLIARVENCRRQYGAVKRKLDLAQGSTTPKRLADSYGCVNHQPNDYPDGENEKTQEEKMSFLKNEYAKVNRNILQINQYMIDTYISQRIIINSKCSMKHIISEWPFLKERKFLDQHAENLIGFSLREIFEDKLKEKLDELMAYVKSIDKKNELDLKPPQIYILKILTTLFHEDLEILMKIYEDEKSLANISEEAPVTPFIACVGNPFEMDPVCTVFVEREPLETQIPLNDAFLMWFSSFYVFNLIYPKECCATLEFIQRALFGINPTSRGNKMEKRFGKRVYVHPQVLKLVNKIRHFSSIWNM